MELLYHTGMRLAELIGIKEAQVDGYGSAIKVLGKGSKERIIPMNTALLKEIKDYTDEKAAKLPEADRVFLLVKDNGKKLYPKYVYNVVKKYLSQVTTIEKKSPHILRHTFATHLANNGADLNAIKELLGHSSLAATQIYTHNSIDKLKDVYKKAHPKAWSWKKYFWFFMKFFFENNVSSTNLQKQLSMITIIPPQPMWCFYFIIIVSFIKKKMLWT